MTSKVKVPDKFRKLPERTPGWALQVNRDSPTGLVIIVHHLTLDTSPQESERKLSETVCELCSVQFSSVAQSCLTLWPHGLQHARPPCPSPTPGVYSNSCPLSQWCHPAISSSSPSPSAFNLSQHQGLFKQVSSSHQVARVLEFQLQHQSFQWIFRTDFL